MLGICYGAQLMMHKLGGKVITPEVGEYGKTEITYSANGVMFKDLPSESVCWMSHFDRIAEAAPGFEVVAHTADCPIAATQNVEKKLYAVQFHPEVLHTKNGTQMIYNFVRGVCGCAGTWKMDSFVKNTIEEIREQVGDGKVLLALSGGVDSSVLAALLAKAIGKQLTCVFVDHGLLRKNEGDEVEGVFGKGGSFDINFVRVNAQERYYSKLAGVTEPERKRKIIGEEFIRVFEEEAKKIGKVDFLAQGTIYPDVVESGLGGESAVIKSHHNVRRSRRSMSISRTSWSHSETSSRTRSARSDWSSDYLTISYSVSHSQAQALESVSSAKSQPKRYALSRMQTGFTEAKWKRQQKSTKRPTARNHHGCQTSTLQPLPTCVQ